MQYYSLKLRDGDTFETQSNVFFTNNPNWKSLQTYMIKLFGGTVSWQANKQNTVTTSITEAELLLLAQTVKETMFALRFINKLGVDFYDLILQFWCNNFMTIRLINAKRATFSTKLKYVDIYNYQLREKKAVNVIRVNYIGTKDILVNGLTKPLAIQQFQTFKDQIGVVNVENWIKAWQLKEITKEDLEQLEDQFEGSFQPIEEISKP